jgi:hypothetical protein
VPSKAYEPAARDYPGRIVDQQDMSNESLLITDNRCVAYGAFPWLGPLGDRERPLTNTRSLLVRDPEAIDEAWARLDGRRPGTVGPRPTPDPRRRHSRRGRSGRRRERGGPSS